MEDLSRKELAAVGSSQQLKDYFERMGCGERVMWHLLKYEWTIWKKNTQQKTKSYQLTQIYIWVKKQDKFFNGEAKTSS